VVARDTSGSDNDANTWMVRLDSDGVWAGWEPVSIQSYHTPGIAEGPNGYEYLAWVEGVADDGKFINFSARPAGSDRDWQQVMTIKQPMMQTREIKIEDRIHLTLHFMPYRTQGGVPFADGSGTLVVFWNQGNAENEKGKNYAHRAYLRGYLAPSHDAEGELKNTWPGWMGNEGVDRPVQRHSMAIAPRYTDFEQFYTTYNWESEALNGILHIPFATGMPLVESGLNRDHDDAAMMSQHLCSSLRTFYGDAEQFCNEAQE
jgi:hypothetical protein